ncbi:tubulin polyglutamylase TTLL11 isoform X2 [Pseudophryne corroboree]|uniref:tubulin polyglutamylase TTLL11 isoform X2 n=1 Tax=Pseudophryne corroboree TaxID=495146 RepID=UPI003081FE3C
MGAGPAVTDSSAMSHTGSRGAAAGGPPGAGGEQGHGVPGLHDRGPRARSALPAQGEDKGLSLGTDYCVAQGTDKGVTQGADKGVTLGTANRVTQGADYWVRQGTDYGVTQGTCNGVTTLGADNGVISQPEMGTDIGVTQVLGLVTGNGIARVPGLGTDNGVTQAPGLVTGNGIARVPGLGTDNGVTQAPGLVTGNGIARVPGLGMDNGVTQAPGLVTGNGIARVPGLGTDNGVTQAPGLVTGNGIARVPGLGTDNGVTQVPGLVTGNGITRVPRLGTDNGVTQAPELVTGKGATLVPQLGTYNRMTGLGTDMWVTQCLGLVTDLRDDNWMTQEMGTNNRVTQVLGMDNRLTQVPGQDTDNEGIQGQRLGTENMVTKGSGQRAPGLVLRPQNGKTQEPRQGDAGLRATSRVRSKRREASGDREGQIGCAGGRSSPFTCPLATTRKSEHRVTAGRGMRSPNKGENNGGQKKVEGRTQRRHVTVDSSKAKSSLEALKISIKQLKWREFPHGRRLPCDIYWHGVSFHESENICSGQVNKFPGMIEMVRKINLSRAVRTMQELYPEEYNFYPQSWILPDEYHLFTAEVRMAKENDPTWKPAFIVKPDGGCQGDGIYLIKDPSEIRIMASVQNRPSVVQEYISNPFVMDKLKFDMRLYVLLKSLEPLEIYIAKDGLSRFCTEPYQEPNHKNLHHIYMHLTNYSLNVHSKNFIHSDSAHTGSKRTFSSILYRLASKGVDVKKVWSDIISLVIKTVIALIPELKVYYQADIPPGKPGPTCFQILGFDILLMKNLKPVLLEVNANPSMKIEHEQELFPGIYENVPSPVDEEVKIAVIRDTLRLVDPARRRNCHTQPHPPDSGQNRKTDLHTGATELAESDGSNSPVSNLSSLCLKQVFPKYSKQFTHLRVAERIAALFIRFLGVKGSMKMGPTGFRTFIRPFKHLSWVS